MTQQSKSKTESKVENKLTIPYPPKEVFANRDVAETMLSEGNVTHLLDHFEYPASGGILIHIVDAKFPKKGFPFPEAIWSINLAKKFFISTLKILTLPAMRGWFIAALLPFKVKVTLLRDVLIEYNRLATGAISPFVLKRQFMTPSSNELEALVYRVLMGLGLDDFTAMQTAQIVGTVIEYDDAYRFRLQDVMDETTKELLIKNPRKEIKRLIGILIERDSANHVKDKMNKVSRLLNLFLLSGRARKAVINGILGANIERLQTDEADRYWMSMRQDYDYGGTKFEDRDVTLLKGYLINV